MNVLIWKYLIRYISITKKRKKTYFKRNDNTNQHRWKSREIKVILKPVRSRENGQWWAQAPHPEWIHTVWKGSGQAKNKMFSEWQTNVRVCTGMRNRQRLKFCVSLVEFLMFCTPTDYCSRSTLGGWRRSLIVSAIVHMVWVLLILRPVEKWAVWSFLWPKSQQKDSKRIISEKFEQR